MPILVIGIVLAVIILVIGLVISAREEKSVVDERLGRFLEEQRAEGGALSQEKSTPLTSWLNDQAGKFSWGENLSKELARADLKLKVGEYLAVIFIAIAGGAIIGYILQKFPGAAGGAFLGFLAPRIYVNSQKSKRLVRFDEQLADMLNLMVNGLRAGYSTMQAMEAVSKELPPPISDEFRRVVQEMQLGVSMERALESLVRRIPSKDLDLVVTAINVQREVGGNLAEILATISHTIRERVRVKGEIRVLTTQASTSAQFLSAMPVFVLIALYFVNRPYLMEMFTPQMRTVGIIVLIIGASMIVGGYLIMQKIASIEV